MQEAYGGTFLLKLFMVFFMIYVIFIGIALNFAKIYRIKNNVINILEQYQYAGDDNEIALTKLDNYLYGVPYVVGNNNDGNNTIVQNHCAKQAVKEGISKNDIMVYHDVCIIPEGSSDARYYKVIVYYVAEFPFAAFGLKDDLSITIPASGETKVIYTK